MCTVATAALSQRVQSGLQQAVAALRQAATGDERLDAGELTDLLKIAFTHRNQIDAALSRAIGALDRVTEQAPDGELTAGLSCAEWLSQNLHISSSAAYAQVHLARQITYLPDTASAFSRGELSPQHASVIVRSVEQVTRGGGDPLQAEGLMLEEARQQDPRNLLRYGLGLLHELAPREMEAQEERREQRRFLRLTEVFDGGYELEGYLDPERGTRLRTAIDAVLGPRLKDDERSPSQRRADGLDEIVTRTLDRGDLPVRGGQRPHLTITASLETLRGDPGAPAALLDWGFPISGKALRRIASDAEITPILLSARGDPLHVGRKYRTATPKMRKALAERDRHCVWLATRGRTCSSRDSTERVGGDGKDPTGGSAPLTLPERAAEAILRFGPPGQGTSRPKGRRSNREKRPRLPAPGGWGAGSMVWPADANRRKRRHS